MPSAFEDGKGGGRLAQLNAGRALLDLFRLVDQQNAADGEQDLLSRHGRRLVDSEDVAVRYPVTGRIVIQPGTLEAGILFSRPPGAGIEDMQRSIVSMMMSLIGTELTELDHQSGFAHQSFADSFVNQAARRMALAENGIGNRGVSTALMASLTVPVDDLAGIVSSRILREAIEQLATPVAAIESTKADMEEFLIKAGVHPVKQRPGVSI